MLNWSWLSRGPKHARGDSALYALLADIDAAVDGHARAQTSYLKNVTFGHIGQTGMTFPFYAAMAILRAARLHSCAKIIVFADRAPTGEFWDMVAQVVDLIVVPPFELFGRTKVHSAELRMDIVRLLALIRLGGVFASTDMMMLANMDELADYPMVLGVEASVPVGRPSFGSRLAVGRRGNGFCGKWLEIYGSGDIIDGDPDRHDCASRLPVRLYAKNPTLVHVLKHDAWFAPSPARARKFLFDAETTEADAALLTDRLALPLWSSVLADDLAAWTPARATTEDCLFARLCREVLPISADDHV